MSPGKSDSFASLLGCILLALLLFAAEQLVGLRLGNDRERHDARFGDRGTSAETGDRIRLLDPPPVRNSPSAEISATPVTVATWNIQVFGESKMRKPDVMAVVVDMVRRFDIVAIQEVRSRNQRVIEDFLRMVNADGARYGLVAGPRVGRTVSREQYLYLYNADRLKVIPESVYSINDVHDVLHREPLVARFEVRAAATDPWTFTLVNIHTDPDEAEAEVNVLDDVLDYIRKRDPEDDVILLGDLNADSRRFGDLKRDRDLRWVVEDQPTNTAGTKTYDNILFCRSRTKEYLQKSGVINLQRSYGLSQSRAMAVSDHRPVWAAFSPAEAGQASVPVRTASATGAPDRL